MSPAHDAGAAAATRVVERPPEGLARGTMSVPAWSVLTLGAAITGASVAYLVWRLLPMVRR